MAKYVPVCYCDKRTIDLQWNSLRAIQRTVAATDADTEKRRGDLGHQKPRRRVALDVYDRLGPSDAYD